MFDPMNLKLEDPIDGVRSIVMKDNKLFVEVDERLDKAELCLIFKDREIDFARVELQPVRRFDFPAKANVKLITAGKLGNSFDSEFGAVINSSGDWCLPGCPTLQIGLPKDCAPQRVRFPARIKARDVSGPLRFRAKLAVHRAVANLVLTVSDLDGAGSEKLIVRFDSTYTGGARSDFYQNVDILLPQHVRNVVVEVAIDYLEFTGGAESTKPFLFLADLYLLEGNPEDELPPQVVPSVRSETWLQAQAAENLTGLWPSIMRVKDRYSAVMTGPADAARAFFDEGWYAQQNSDVDFSTTGCFSHYLLKGWRERRKPNREFSVREYLMRHPEVEAAGYEPLFHYANVGKKAGISLGTFEQVVVEIWDRSGERIPDVSPSTIFRRAQDLMVPMEMIDTRKLAVFIVPEHDAMSGGIYSIFSIADHIRRSRRTHGFDTILMTRPNAENVTYIRNSAFSNPQTVFNVEQLRLFREVSELHLYIPEYATVGFVRNLSEQVLKYIVSRDMVHINVLNQNTRLMPKPSKFRDLRRIADTVGQSVSHHAYFGQEFADYYNLPSLLLPAYTDLSAYPPAAFEEKEDIILYSDDNSPYREAVLSRLAGLEGYQLVKVQGMTFDKYMDYANRCRFSVSFGEGFDGYVAQPIYQGGIGFALYNDEFFPGPEFKKFENFFVSEAEMIEQIVPTIQRLQHDKKRYELLNQALRAKWDELYSYEDYVRRIKKLIMSDYDIYPQTESVVEASPPTRLR